jgi:hypothetical protein
LAPLFAVPEERGPGGGAIGPSGGSGSGGPTGSSGGGPGPASSSGGGDGGGGGGGSTTGGTPAFMDGVNWYCYSVLGLLFLVDFTPLGAALGGPDAPLKLATLQVGPLKG